MTRLRSGKTISFENRTSRRHGFHAPAKPNRHQTRKATGKKKPQANSTGGQSRNRPIKINHDALTRNIRYQQRARANELATGDSADTLREKRRWVQEEFDSSRIDGKVTRELHDLYSKKVIGRLDEQRAKAQSLSNAAKEVKQRLEEVFKERLGARPAAGAVAQPSGNVRDDEGDTNHSNLAAARTAAENDAIARQWALDNGYVLYSATNQGTGVEEGEEGEDGEEGEEGEEREEREEGEEGEGEGVEVKVEEEADE